MQPRLPGYPLLTGYDYIDSGVFWSIGERTIEWADWEGNRATFLNLSRWGVQSLRCTDKPNLLAFNDVNKDDLEVMRVVDCRSMVTVAEIETSEYPTTGAVDGDSLAFAADGQQQGCLTLLHNGIGNTKRVELEGGEILGGLCLAVELSVLFVWRAASERKVGFLGSVMVFGIPSLELLAIWDVVISEPRKGVWMCQPAYASGQLFVPTPDGVLILDMSTGEIATKLQMRTVFDFVGPLHIGGLDQSVMGTSINGIPTSLSALLV